MDPLVDFRMIVFRPFKGEIINATVKLCTPDGIQCESSRPFCGFARSPLAVTTEFFQDIYVPKTMLFEDCEL